MAEPSLKDKMRARLSTLVDETFTEEQLQALEAKGDFDWLIDGCGTHWKRRIAALPKKKEQIASAHA